MAKTLTEPAPASALSSPEDLDALKRALLEARTTRGRAREAYDDAVRAAIAERDDPTARRRLGRAAGRLEEEYDQAEEVCRAAESQFRSVQDAVTEAAMRAEEPALRRLVTLQHDALAEAAKHAAALAARIDALGVRLSSGAPGQRFGHLIFRPVAPSDRICTSLLDSWTATMRREKWL